jgi:hypothetical protein
MMTVQELIDELIKLDPNQPVYLSDDDLDNDTYYYQLSGIAITQVEGEDILTLTHRK